MDNGWIKLNRTILDSKVWNKKEPFDYRSAYIDLLLMAAYKDTTIVTKQNRLVNLKRGQTLVSDDYLSKRWNWSRNRVRHYFEVLEGTGLATTEGTNGGISVGTIVTLIEYGFSEYSGTNEGTKDGTNEGTNEGTHIKNKRNKEEKEIYGEYENVTLSKDEYQKLADQYGEYHVKKAIEYLSSYKIEKGYKSKSDYLTIRRWVMDAVTKNSNGKIVPLPADPPKEEKPVVPQKIYYD